jgi:predicted N-acetyltransferase YhbS
VTVRVRLEEPDDRTRSLEVERAAFGSDEEPAIVEAIRDLEGSFALVAEGDGEVVGHVQLSRAWVGGSEVLALGPVGVLPAHQRRGIGSSLVRGALEEARRRAEVAVILLGDPGFYQRFGFEPAAEFGLRNPYAGSSTGDLVIAEEDFMLAPLDEGARELGGEVRWHPAFGAPVEERGRAL